MKRRVCESELPEEDSEKSECGGREEGEDGELGRLKTVGSENRRKGRVLIDTELRFRVRNHGNWEPTSLGLDLMVYLEAN